MSTSTEELIPLCRVGRRINAPSPPHLSTVLRWALRGIGTPPVRLATVKVGGRRYTTQSAIDAFIVALSGPRGADPATATRRRETAVRRAEHALDADGVS